ncbi:MAG TPA: hypothetical protein VHQ95_17895, partial [Pyrinomonadaceae bacterium]|nr:hypothetical protein [Pyrinomonadaceae bacterium]
PWIIEKKSDRAPKARHKPRVGRKVCRPYGPHFTPGLWTTAFRPRLLNAAPSALWDHIGFRARR